MNPALLRVSHGFIDYSAELNLAGNISCLSKITINHKDGSVNLGYVRGKPSLNQ
jgi:hypothetical protein